MLVRWIAITVCAVGVGSAEEGSGLSAARLYYQGAGQQGAPNEIGKRGVIRPSVSGPGTGTRLGIRYNLLDVDPKGTRAAVTVDPDAMWKVGQCAAVRLEANRGGYLYVLARGSSGVWQPLLPSPEAAGEPLHITPYSPTPIPRDHCFEILPPAGKERLFVIVSERREDLAELEKAIRQGDGSGALKQSALNGQVDRLRTELRGRDLKVQKIARAGSAQETPHSVFVVAADSRPNDRLVVEIEINHP